MENHFNQNHINYLEAKTRVKELRKFYIHLLFYFGINALVFFDHWRKLGDQFTFKDGFNFYTGVLWGIVIVIHAISLFLPAIRNWEKDKINEILNKKQNNGKSI